MSQNRAPYASRGGGGGGGGRGGPPSNRENPTSGGGGAAAGSGGGGGIPPAPYPPMMISPRYPSTQLSSLRSSLSSAPHYRTGSGSPASAASAAAAGGDSSAAAATKAGSAASMMIPTAGTGAGAVFDGRVLPPSMGAAGVNHGGVGGGAVRAGPGRVEESRGTAAAPKLETGHPSGGGAGALANSGGAGTSAVDPHSHQAQFCGRDLLASINSAAAAASPSVVTTTAGRKRGPVLLELSRLVVNGGGGEHQERDGLFALVPVCMSRSNPSLGTSLSSTTMQVAPSSAMPPYYHSSSDHHRPSPVATGLTTGALCIHTFHRSSIGDRNGGGESSSTTDPYAWTPSIEYYHTPRYHRPATAVAWRPSSPRQVAIGLVSPSSASALMDPATGAVMSGRRGGVGGVAGGVVAAAASAGLGGMGGSSSRADRSRDGEYCCYIWDVEHQSSSSSSGGSTTASGRRSKSTPLYKLSHQVGVASLGWVLEGGQTLCVGGSRNLQLYDLRAKGTGPQQAPVSVYAHNFGVHGVVPDPNRPWQFATYCRAANEPIKLWDSRRMDSVLGEIKILGSTKMGDAENYAITVSAVKWSKTETGKIVVAVGEAIHEYDTSSSRPTLINTVYARDNVVDFALYPYAPASGKQQQPEAERSLDDDLIAEYFPKRMVTVHGDGSLRDLSRHTQAPVAISYRDGRVVHAFGKSLWIGATNEGPSAMESLKIDELNEDVSAKMMRRARCQVVSRYSMDTTANIKLLAENGLQAEGAWKENVRSQREALLRLWSWIERVESLCSEKSEDLYAADGGTLNWAAKGLIDAGAWRLLRADDDVAKDEEIFSETLCCTTYDSPGRRAALTSCGWAGKFSLANVLGECEGLGEYERSAALACWHGDIGHAVEALERGASYIRVHSADKRHSKDPRFSAQYAEILELVSLSVAGYRGGDLSSSTSGIWRRACANLLQRPDLALDSPIGSRVAYLRSVLKFLISLGSDNSYQEVVSDTSLSLCDRVGLACRFLRRDELYKFTEKCLKACQANGDCEGITVTGIEKEGITILQSYVDLTADVQTAALVTSRVLLPSDWTTERSICLEWLDCYRSLLNSRAMFDVDRADLLRKLKAKQQTGTMTMMGSDPKQVSLSLLSRRTGMTPGPAAALGARRPSGMRQPDPDIQASVPAQLDARCNYCNSSLGLKNQDKNASQWLSKMKPVLSCCQHCRKPLPRCAICMLPLGALNPYMELTKRRGAGGTGSSIAPSDDLSSLASLPFAEWFTWCMRCKHGGHAHHMVGWFSKFSVCPVSGCDCKCQFDGIQKLNRPALVADD